MKTKAGFFSFFLLFSLSLQAQTTCSELFILQGGIFSTQNTDNPANLALRSWCGSSSNSSFLSIDTIGTFSVQDLLLLPNEYLAYAAAQDSIIKYDLRSGQRQRIAAQAFGAPSTIKLGIWEDKLLVGNWYEPFGHTGPFERHLLLYDTANLALVDSVPDILQGAKDFVILGDTAYISQNSNNSNFEDTLGYLVILDLNTLTVVRRDTLANNGEDLGRLLLYNDSTIVAFNKVSQTISQYNTNTGAYSTAAANVSLELRGTGQGAALINGTCYIPYNGGIGSYDPINRQALQSGILAHDASGFIRGFAWTMDSAHIYLAKINFSDQTLNMGYRSDLQGNVLDSFALGFSPEVLRVWSQPEALTALRQLQKQPLAKLYPNPTSQLLSIEAEESIGYWQVFDALGRLLMQGQSADALLQLDLGKLPSGQYIFRREAGAQLFIKN